MWRKLTEDDLIATLSRDEVDAYKKDFEVEAVEKILSDTAEEVRGYIASGRKCRMCPEEGTVPAMTISKALDCTAFRLLKRLDLVPNEARMKAYEEASRFFERISSGEIVPEDYGEPLADGAKQVACAPAFSPPAPARLLD